MSCSTATSTSVNPMMFPSMNPLFGGNWGEKTAANWMNSPMNSTFGGYPSTFGGFPSTFGGFPSTFGGNVPTWSNWSPMWSNWSPMWSNWNNWSSNWSPMWSNWNNLSSNWSPMSSNWFGEKPSWWNKFYSNIRDATFRPTNMAEFFTFNNPIHISPVDGSRMLYLCFDVKGFKPEEIKVEINAKERLITVSAVHDVKDKEHTVTRNYIRKFVIPSEYLVDLTKCEIKSHLTFDGVLCIEGVLPKMTSEELKTLKEKCPSKLTNTFGAICPAGFTNFESMYGCTIPVKTN